ncbi:MAG: 2-hydroxyacyl-CoA dehydratase [Clostridia bacterium]|nr:2-hydroxyacyl-CoA dehydratase [Clostridia bacterium]
MNVCHAGMDVGSTTVKLVLLSDDGRILFEAYRRHQAHTQETLAELLREAREQLGPMKITCAMTGSGAMNLYRLIGVGFVQEVVAVARAIEMLAPQTDVAIELGGEDAKIIYFRGGLEERMNGVCAGGTGAFIDQMAALLQTDATGLNREAADYQEIYPIAARCGVFAKSDIQPLINEGATTPDLAASIFQAVVNQTISGLACGKPIRGTVAFLGGPLHFLPELRQAFIRTLHLTEETAVVPENAHLFAAIGAAEESREQEAKDLDELLTRLSQGVKMTYELKRMEPLFGSREEYYEFVNRHDMNRVRQGKLEEHKGPCYLGIDAGSTTTKLALIDGDGTLLWAFYSGNQGSPLRTAQRAIRELKERLPEGAQIVRSCSTGYGENLMKAAFNMEEGEVETIAHARAATFFDPDVDCVVDIGGQDMKYIRLKDGSVDNVLLNEACSSGCGSFLENFASSLGYSAEGFAMEAVQAEHPIDLGTRCTVFMNSNVKQAQKEGAEVRDIAAGLAYSVIRNALFKVIKLADPSDMGSHVVVQGGTFNNPAVLRAFEKISGLEVTRPDIAGIMGAFGAALLARDRHERHPEYPTTLLPLDEMLSLTWQSETTHCQGCTNRCMLTVTDFGEGRVHITGNRCERGLGKQQSTEKGPNVSEYKRHRMFQYKSLKAEEAKRGEIGIPRVLNMWENFPFWHTFFTNLGFRVILSPMSNRSIYTLGMETIPSESECYPAKISHGHVQWLINHGIKTIFHPSVFYEHLEVKEANNQFNCPIVCAYPENLKNNVDDVVEGKVRYIRPFMSFESEKITADRMVKLCREEWNIPEREVRDAVHAAWQEQRQAKADVRAEGKKALAWMQEHHKKGIVLAGRPYHVDPEIHHGIPELIASYGLAVLTEDCVPEEFHPARPVRVNDQWVYHSRLYTAAQWVTERDDLELIQLNSFGCGLDAVTTDQVAEILEESGKLYTLLKIDEVNNLGAARIRVRSLLAAMREREERGIQAKTANRPYERVYYTKEMQREGYTILAPRMSPIHFDLLEPVFRKFGYHLVMLKNDTRSAVDMGLRFVNNDACYPSIITVGQMMDAVLSGEYDTDHLALLMSQTGGCCRASNYVGFIRRALKKAGYEHIPVISANLNGMEKNPGFTASPAMLMALAKCVLLGDLLSRCLFRVRPYEMEKGSANRLCDEWSKICIDDLTARKPYGKHGYRDICCDMVKAFDELPLTSEERKPRVGIVGEILVKYMPFANNHLAETLEAEGAEVVLPDLMDFLAYTMYNLEYKHDYLGKSWTMTAASEGGIRLIDYFRRPAVEALKQSRRFEAPVGIREIGEMAKPILSLGNQYGEGWFLTGEMVELIRNGCPNIVCIQPFACLPNHVVGKGVIKQLKLLYPQSNIVAVDFDPGASEVNQLNRIKLMLSTARKQAQKEAEAAE